MLFLTPDTDLEHLLSQMAAQLNRPVCLSGDARKSKGGVYKRPGGSTYEDISALELFCSGWMMGDCVRRETKETGQSTFYYDLRPASAVRICFPLLEGEALPRGVFGAFGLSRTPDERRHIIWLRPKGQVPLELEPYRVSYRAPWGPRADGIQFQCSDWIEAPREQRWDWHLGTTLVLGPDPSARIFPLQPPAWYSGQDITSLEDNNRLAVVEADPGQCAVCRGASGAKKHLGVLASDLELHIAMHICSACLPRAFEQILALVNQ